MKAKALALCLLPVLASYAVLAQSGPDNDPAVAQGYIDNYFHHSDVDSINQFNGQLTVPIPIGPTYQIGPSLTFQASLTYNTRLTEPGHPTDETNPNYYPIVGDPAVGIGWTFTAGKIACGAVGPLNPPPSVCYVRPDGAQIDLYAISQGSTTFKTIDATQYKLVRNGSGPYTYTLWDGDGNRYDFTKVVTGFDDNINVAPGYAHDYGRGRNGYYLTSLQDPFGNSMTVTYAANGTNPCPFTCPGFVGSMQCGSNGLASWIPSTFSIQRVGGSAQPIGQVVTDSTLERIKALQFRTFAAGVSQLSQWDLIYGTSVLSNRNASLYCSTQLQTLTEIRLPIDVTDGSGGRVKYSFGYTGVSADQGYLTTLTLPTGAQIFYEYGAYHFYRGRLASMEPGCQLELPASNNVLRSVLYSQSAGAPEAPQGSPPCLPTLQSSQAHPGVLRRTVSGPGMTTAATDYTQWSFPKGENGNAEPQSLTVAVLPPNAGGVRRAEATLFSAANASFDPNVPSLPGDRVGAALRHAFYESDPNPGLLLFQAPTCDGVADTLCATHAIRVTQNLYQYGDTEFIPPLIDNDGDNRRLGLTRIYYGQITAKDPRALDYCPSGCLKNTQTSTLSAGHTWDTNGRHYDIECLTPSASGNCNPAALGIGDRATTTTWAANDAPPIHLLNLYSKRVVTEGGVASCQFSTGCSLRR